MNIYFQRQSGWFALDISGRGDLVSTVYQAGNGGNADLGFLMTLILTIEILLGVGEARFGRILKPVALNLGTFSPAAGPPLNDR